MKLFAMEMYFERHNCSDETVDKVINQAPGRPFLDENRKKIGIVNKATRVRDTKIIEFEVDIL